MKVAIELLEKTLPQVNQALYGDWLEGDISEWSTNHFEDSVELGHSLGYYEGYKAAVDSLKNFK